jgi:AraC-like DNA-binding protein
MAQDGTVAVWGARPVLAALRVRGVDEAPVFRAARISVRALEDPDARFPYRAVVHLWEAAAEASGDPFFGIHLAGSADRGTFDVLEYLGSASKTLGEAYARVARYARLLYDRTNVRLIIEPRQARLIRRTVPPAVQYTEYIIAYMLARGRQWTGRMWCPERLRFQHDSPPGRSRRLPLFRCSVEFGAIDTEVRLAPKLMRLPLEHADSRLLDILLRYADGQLAALPDAGDLAAKAAHSIARQVASRRPSLASTATLLRTTPRTLQRRLAEKGLSYAVVFEEVIRSLALKYIVHAGLSIDEIAYLLHFSDGTAFYRAFKRWTGESPLQYRRRTLSGD